jgi:hypothetical protein
MRDLVRVCSHCLATTVTNDSIAPNAQPLIWGAFVRIRFAPPGKRAAGLGFVRTNYFAEPKNVRVRASRASTSERNSRESETSLAWDSCAGRRGTIEI